MKSTMQALENLIRQEKLEAKDAYQSTLTAQNKRREASEELNRLKATFFVLDQAHSELQTTTHTLDQQLHTLRQQFVEVNNALTFEQATVQTLTEKVTRSETHLASFQEETTKAAAYNTWVTNPEAQPLTDQCVKQQLHRFVTQASRRLGRLLSFLQDKLNTYRNAQETPNDMFIHGTTEANLQLQQDLNIGKQSTFPTKIKMCETSLELNIQQARINNTNLQQACINDCKLQQTHTTLQQTNNFQEFLLQNSPGHGAPLWRCSLLNNAILVK